jgi:hypothetical protein
MLLIPHKFLVEFLQSGDIMGLRPTTMHENRLRPLSPVFSMVASPIFHGSEGSAFCFFQEETADASLRSA